VKFASYIEAEKAAALTLERRGLTRKTFFSVFQDKCQFDLQRLDNYIAEECEDSPKTKELWLGALARAREFRQRAEDLLVSCLDNLPLDCKIPGEKSCAWFRAKYPESSYLLKAFMMTLRGASEEQIWWAIWPSFNPVLVQA